MLLRSSRTGVGSIPCLDRLTRSIPYCCLSAAQYPLSTAFLSLLSLSLFADSIWFRIWARYNASSVIYRPARLVRRMLVAGVPASVAAKFRSIQKKKCVSTPRIYRIVSHPSIPSTMSGPHATYAAHQCEAVEALPCMVAMRWVDDDPVLKIMLLRRGRSHGDDHPTLSETSGGGGLIKPADG